MKKIIGLTYDVKEDWKPKEGDPADINAEFDPPAVIDSVVSALESKGHTVKRIGNVNSLLSQIDNLGVDIVFNLAEGRTGRNRESQVPVILEMKNIPYIGSDGLTLGLTLDKVISKKLFVSEGIPTPRFFEATSTDDIEKLNTIGFPLIVKSRFEGSSKGLSEKSKVDDYVGLKRQAELINTVYDQPALVEEFIRGSEFTVAVVGNEAPIALPVVQVEIDGKLDLGDKFYTFARITSPNLKYICPAKISKELTYKLQSIALKVYQCVECKDFGRVDFRVDEKGNPYVLEINPLPCLSVEDTFGMVAKAQGRPFQDIIDEIISYGLNRYGLNNGKHKGD